MMEIDPASVATTVGMLAGVLGVGIAVWLQMVATRKCPPKYVVLFFGFGAGLMLVNYNAATITVVGGSWLPLIGNVCLILTEVYAFRWVVDEVSVCQPGDFVASKLKDD